MMSAARPNFDLSVYFILDPDLCSVPIPDVLAAALSGGVAMVQFRDKISDPLNVTTVAKTIKEQIDRYNISTGRSVLFLVNDFAEIAHEIGADGVHIGQGDMKPEKAREILGPDKILGLTAFTEEHIDAVDPAIVDYIGTGPFYETKTDKGKPVLGAARFTELAARSPVPGVGIGGVTPVNANAVIKAGADGVAMMRAISGAEDPKVAAESFVQVVRQAREEAGSLRQAS